MPGISSELNHTYKGLRIMDLDKVKEVFFLSARDLKKEEQEFSALDTQTGDGDHGVTIARIADVIMNTSKDTQITGLGLFFSAISEGIMAINGGAIVPLWSMMMDGVSEALAGQTEPDGEMVRKMIIGAMDGISSVSSAVPGDKTLLDALQPAVTAAANAEGSCRDILGAAAKAAMDGAEKTRDMVAKYGRAKNMHERSLGHLDPGAVSLAVFINSLYKNSMEGGEI